MARIRDLAEPPIQEAVIDFLFDCTPLPEDKVRELALRLRLGPDWITDDLRQIKSTLDLKDPSNSIHSNTFDGVLAKSADERALVQVRGDRITVSNVWSYRTWEDLQEFGFKCVGEFAKDAGPRSIKRLATRFINALPLAGPFSEVLAHPPESAIVGGEVTEFFDRKLLRFGSSALVASFSIGTSTTPLAFGGEPKRALIIDVDAYMEGAFPCDEQSLSKVLSELRNAKNRIFFGALTDDALENCK